MIALEGGKREVMELWVAITILASAGLGGWSGYARFVKEVGKEKANETPSTDEMGRLQALAQVQKVGRENWGTEEQRALYRRKTEMISETAVYFAGIVALLLAVLFLLGSGYSEWSE